MELLTAIGPVFLYLVVFFGGAALQNKLSGRVNVSGQKPLYRRKTGYSVRDVDSYWKALGPAGQKAEKRFLNLDLLFPVFYGGALLWAFWLYWDASRGFPWAAGAVILLVLSDWTENTAQLVELGRFMGGNALRPVAVGLASVATVVKYWSGVVCVLLLLAGAASKLA